MKLRHPSLYLYIMIKSYPRVPHTPITAFPEYWICSVLHTQSTAYTVYCIMSPAPSLSLTSRQTMFYSILHIIPQLLINQTIESQRLSPLPPEQPPPVWPHPSCPQSSLDHGLEVHLQTDLNSASKFAFSIPPSTYLLTCSIMASKCILNLA